MDAAIMTAAHELTLKFQDDSDIPERFNSGRSEPVKKFQRNSQIEQRFQQHVMNWENTIRTILNHIPDRDQAWRFIRMTPKIDEMPIGSVTENRDWNEFFDYLVVRRDDVKCGPDELGHLCMLHTALQRVVEKTINTK